MLIFDEDRASDSPYVERVWRAHSEGEGSFVSIAESRAEIVVTKHRGRIMVTIRGPETRPTRGPYPDHAEWLGIRLKPGAHMLPQPASRLVDRQLNLPEAANGSFWLKGSTWQVPDSGNAETFAEWLARDDLLGIDPAVRAALHGRGTGSSPRTLQRHFLQATGVTHRMTRQIERARFAVLLLTSGLSIPDATQEAGYFDQPHLTRSMKHFIGQTPAQLLDERSDQLSYLYKTQPFDQP